MASEAAVDDVHGPGGNKDAAGGGAGAVRPPEQGLKCPRCDSPNTKFCYYNNYSLAQPRYFCKTCRRYWTKGGALRNVPVGGGCRKSKKSKSSSSNPSVTSSIRLSSDGPAQELRLYQLGIPPAVDFHLGAGGLPFSRLHHPSAAGPPGIFNPAAAEGGAANHLISFGDLSCSAAALPTEAAGATAGPLLGFSYPIQGVVPPPFTDVGIGAGGDATTSGTNLAAMHSNLAASIESLSSINQGLHWKLQQQRLAMFFGDEQSQQHHGKEGSDAAATAALPSALLEGANRPMSCQMPASSKEICTPAAAGGVSGKGSMGGDNNSGTTEWFLGSTPTSYTTPTAHGSLNNGSSAAGSNWNGVQAWNDMHQFSALP